MSKTFIGKTLILTAVFMTTGLTMSCGQSSKIEAIGVNKPGETNKNSMNMPSPQNSNKQNSNQNNQTEPIDLSGAQTVSYCELVKNPAQYDRQIVRVRAIYYTAFEKTYLYEERCETNQPPVAPEKVPAEIWAEWDKSLVTKGDSEEAVLNRQLNGFGRKDVTVIGRFNSTNAQNDANAPNLFGHMNCCRFQFLIMRAEKVSQIEMKTVNFK